MTAFTAIDLDKLPAPEIVPLLTFEVILAARKARLIELAPDLELALGLESDPLVKFLEAESYRELLLRQEFDEGSRSNMLAFATGSALDNLAANFGVSRAVIQVEDLAANPPIPEILEDDKRLRLRTQLSLEARTTAGSVGSYVFWGLTSSPLVKDIGVFSPEPGQVQITVLGSVDNGVPDAALLAQVTAGLNDEDIRPLSDTVVVQAATIQNYTVEAVLTVYEGPDQELVKAAAIAATEKYTNDQHVLGHDITISGLHRALHQEGVQNVSLISPAADIVVPGTGAAFNTLIDITVGGIGV